MMTWVRFGPSAILIRFANRVDDESFARSRAIARELEANPPPGMAEFVPAFTTVLVEFDPASRVDLALAAEFLIPRLEAAALVELPESPIKEIPVIYGGPDLERLAELHQLDARTVVELHAAPVYKVYLLGFSPGFPYLGDLDPRLHTPRLASPRPKVAAGSVAIGGRHTGIYSVDSPGGWNLIGRTPVRVFDPSRRQPDSNDDAMFWLRPGDRVRFIPI